MKKTAKQVETESAKTDLTNTPPASNGLVQIWGKTLIASGYTALPNIVFRQQKALALSRLDVLVLLHLVSHWWKASESPFPAKATLAAAMDVDPRTVQRSIEKMEKLGYVKRTARWSSSGDNSSNSYNLKGLIAAATKLAEVELAKRQERALEDRSAMVTPRAYAAKRARAAKANS